MKTKAIIFIFFALVIMTGCQQSSPIEDKNLDPVVKSEKGMVKVTLLYPNEEGSTFDMDYYQNKHMPMVQELLGDAMKYFKIDKGLAGRVPEQPVPYHAIGYLYFDKLSDYQEAFGPVAQQIIGDIPNYTNVQPSLLISEVVE